MNYVVISLEVDHLYISRETGQMSKSVIRTERKTYQFTSKDKAQSFADAVNARSFKDDEDTRLFATVVDELPEHNRELVAPIDCIAPIFLHVLWRYENAIPKFVPELHDVYVYTVEEIEQFRNENKHPSIVFAYDNLDSLEFARFASKEVDCQDNDGNYYFISEGDDEGVILSFNEDIADILLNKAHPELNTI